MGFYTQDELETIGFKSIGKSVSVSKRASIYNAANISIGNNTRIDDFCVLSAGEGGISIGNHVHVAVYVSIIGSGKVVMEDYTCLSGRCSIYSSNDDYSGEFMTNPTVLSELTNVNHAPVTIRRHSLVGAGTIILPGVEIGECTAVGAMSLVTKSLDAKGIYAGQPVKKIKDRSAHCLKLEQNNV